MCIIIHNYYLHVHNYTDDHGDVQRGDCHLDDHDRYQLKGYGDYHNHHNHDHHDHHDHHDDLQGGCD